MTRWLAIGVLSFLCLILRAPAHWVERLVDAYGHGFLMARSSTGTLWQGNTELWLRGPNDQWIPWQVFHWNINFSRVFQGRIELDSSIATVTMSADGLQLTRLRLSLPAAAVLPHTSSVLARMAWEGDILVESESMLCNLLRGGQCQGRASVRWLHVASPLFSEPPVDSIVGDVTASGRSLTITVSSTGQLAAQAAGEVRDNAVQLNGVVRGPGPVLDGLQQVAGDIVLPGATAEERRIQLRWGE